MTTPRTPRRRGTGASRARFLLALLLPALLVLAGCATIPTTSGIGSRPLPEEDGTEVVQPDPDGPAEGAEVGEIVRGFLQAGTGYADDHGTARQYLTGDFQQSWQPSSSVLVLTEGTTLSSLTPTVAEDQTRVTVQVPVVATLDGANVLHEVPRGTSSELQFTLRQIDGEWRIMDGPDGTVMSARDFDTLYKQFPLYFFTPDLQALVPDDRWVMRTPAIATEVVQLLLAGPAEHLGSSVVSSLPLGVRLEPSAVTVTDGRAAVGLSAEADSMSAEAQARMIAQIDRTLGDITSEVTVSAPSGDLQVDPVSSLGTYSPSEQRFIGIREEDRRLVIGARSSELEPVEDLDPLPEDAAAPAISPGGDVFAWLRDDGASLVRYRPGQDPATVLTAQDDGAFRGPSVDRFGTLWVYDTARGAIRTVTSAGATTDISAGFLTDREVRGLQVSRDGTRLAVLSTDTDGVGTRVDVVGILRSGARSDATGLASTTTLQIGLRHTGIRDLSWAGPDALVLLVADTDESDASSARVVHHTLAGVERELGKPEDAVDVTAPEDGTRVRAATPDGDVWELDAGTSQVNAVGVVDVAFPG
ncbi:LpqB family beta-propeller domain-containing protein [Brevibacterium litoralis]|uniref:LpqB family beta-propeller domain-containing protein n=1 Tax=Brevibacterium litoralis TaxID=3138935 RepID=UPI0032EB97BA